MKNTYDIIVVGGGHAGCEAAYAAACMGAKTLLITMDMTKLAQMSCNPAMGGIAKGQIVREIDALGGCSGIVTDLTMLQFRMLNRSKGPAMWSPRAQCDRVQYSIEWRKILETSHHVDIWQDSVNGLIIEDGRIKGVTTKMQVSFYAHATILTIGTFENGIIYIGKVKLGGGRIGELTSTGITEQLKECGIESDRLKTGTPARIDGRSIDFSVLEEQKGDDRVSGFSFLKTPIPSKQLSCYITYTNEKVHQTLMEGFDDSPLYNGTIKGIGPRYCPSIESKIVTFNEKGSHQLFLEPEGWHTNEYYLNGFSSSLPLEVQYKAINQIRGLEHAVIYRPGYAIEYDFFQPTQLLSSLESKKVENLFMAGQINGTTGYEEAAAQGLMAGINAALKVQSRTPLVLKRDEAYIGVLIDDLVTKGVDEPYRMFTSRAEYRILLRQDNADERLTPISIEMGLATDQRRDLFLQKRKAKERVIQFLKRESIDPGQINPFLLERNTSGIRQKVRMLDLLLRPEISLAQFIKYIAEMGLYQDMDRQNDMELLEAVEIELKYNGYIQREKLVAEKMGRLDHIKIDKSLDIESMMSISTEGRFKLLKYKPETIGQAARISGISPSDIHVLLMYMGR